MMWLTHEQLRQRVLHGRPRRRFIIPGVLPAGPSILFGASGLGKTGLAIATAVRVATGQLWGGIPIERGAVLYVAGEDFHGVEDRLVAAGLDIYEGALPLALTEPPEGGIASKGSALVMEEAARQLADECGLPVRLVVIDTLAASFGPTSQDDAAAASVFMGEIDRLSRDLECAVLAIHHTGKSGSSMRGSQVFFDRADAVLSVAKMEKRASLTVSKMRNGPSGASFSYSIASRTLETRGGPVSTQIVPDIEPLRYAGGSHVSEKPRRRTDADVALSLLQALESTCARGSKIKISVWRDAWFAEWSGKPSDSTRRTAFHAARRSLEKKGMILPADDFVSVSVSRKTTNKSLTEVLGVSVSVSEDPLGGPRSPDSADLVVAPPAANKPRVA